MYLANFFLTIIIIFFCKIEVSAQSYKIDLPSINIGVAFRDQGIEFVKEDLTAAPYNFSYNAVDRQVYFSLDIEQKLFKKKRFVLEFSNYINYSTFKTSFDTVNNVIKSSKEKRIKHDHFLSLLYTFKPNKKSIIFVFGAGLGYMNLGTSFPYYTSYETDIRGNPIYREVKGSLEFFAPKLIIGLKKERFSGYINLNGTPDSRKKSNPTLWVEAKITYNIYSFNKK